MSQRPFLPPLSFSSPVSFNLSQLDAHRLRQLLLILADNAVKYNNGGSIVMTLSRSDGFVKFAIANTSEGIKPEALPRVFERFFRGDPAHSNQVEGCGLGLSIARWIVSTHRGSIRIDSEPGGLTTVTLKLPAMPQGE